MAKRFVIPVAVPEEAEPDKSSAFAYEGRGSAWGFEVSTHRDQLQTEPDLKLRCEYVRFQKSDGLREGIG